MSSEYEGLDSVCEILSQWLRESQSHEQGSPTGLQTGQSTAGSLFPFIICLERSGLIPLSSGFLTWF